MRTPKEYWRSFNETFDEVMFAQAIARQRGAEFYTNRVHVPDPGPTTPSPQTIWLEQDKLSGSGGADRPLGADGPRPHGTSDGARGGGRRRLRAVMGYVLRRLVTQLIPVLFLASILIFASVRLIPGDPVAGAIGDAMGGTDPEVYEELREELGLNKPMYEQYWIWLGQMFTGDFGQSLTGLPVTEILWNAIPASVELAGLAIIFGFSFGLLLGVLAAINRGGFFDWFARCGRAGTSGCRHSWRGWCI